MRPNQPNPNRRPKSFVRPAAGSAPASTDWNSVADWYDGLVGDEGSEFHQKVILPRTLKLLEPQPGRKMLDVACGQGVLCRVLAKAGVECTGVDSSLELIRMARERAEMLPVATPMSYQVGDARDLSFLSANHFDSAACVLAIQNIHPILPLCAAVARVVLPGGKFVIVMMHPCFRGVGETSWGWDESARVQYRRIERYLLPRKNPIVTHPGSAPGKYTWTFHKPIEDYVKALSSAGLLVDTMEEWPSHKQSDSGPRAPAENKAREEIPMFLAIRAIKVGG